MNKPLNAKKHNLIIGETYGRYKILDQIEIPNGNKGIKRLWKCLNIDNNKIINTSATYIIKNSIKKTQKEINEILLSTNTNQKGLRHFLYASYKRNAKRRNIDFNLTFEEFNKIIQQNCYYCNNEPSHPTEKILKERGNINEPSFAYNGIDRLDNELGYNIDNCVPCCSKCNYMKWVLTEKDFLKKIKEINENFIKCQETD